MLSESRIDCERRSLEKMKNYQLPNRFKKIGIAVAILSFLALLVNKFSLDSQDVRVAARYGMLLGMLFISISKEKIEDELVSKLRMQSYTFAFIFGVIFTIVQPFLNFGIDSLVDGDAAVFKDSGDFMVLWMLLSIQVFYFEKLKRMYK